MRLSEMLHEIGNYEAGNDFLFKKYLQNEIKGACSDSRKITSGYVFFCIKGARFDGHYYAGDVIAKGCKILVCEHMPAINIPNDVLVLTVADSRKAYAKALSGIYGHPDKKMCMIGITGTKGKTSTALMIKAILTQNNITAGYIGTNGIIFADEHIQSGNTTPDSGDIYYYLSKMLSLNIRTVIIEVSSQALWQSRVYGIEFDICIFTNISEDHIGGYEHPSFEHYMNSKALLFTDYNAKHIIYNADEKIFLPFFEKCHDSVLHPYSINSKAGFYADNIELRRNGSDIGVDFTLHFDDLQNSENSIDRKVSLSIPGEFNIYNALAAITACRIAGGSIDRIIKALETVHIDGRFETVCLNSKPDTTFVIDYAHNGLSLEAVLKTAAKYSHNRIICVFGSVGGRTYGRRLELGKAAAKYADLSILTADNPDCEAVPHITRDIKQAFIDAGCEYKCMEIFDRTEAIKKAFEIAGKDDIVILAGKGHEKYQLISGETVPFSEREILLELDMTAASIPN